MRISNLLSDDAVATEIGRRISQIRLEHGLTQAELAQRAGVSKSTIERMESAGSTQLSSLIRCLRVLDKLGGLEHLLPETPPNPVDLLKRHGKIRRRAVAGGGTSESFPLTENSPPLPPWIWGDET